MSERSVFFIIQVYDTRQHCSRIHDWLVALALHVLLEKVLPREGLIAQVAGVLIIGRGVWLLAGVLIC